MRPPRALWVPFPLGRPLGVAGDPEFQRAVLVAALDLVETATEPTIADYPHDAPGELDVSQWACPINLGVAPDDSLTSRFRNEVASLRPWFDVAVERQGRTFFGVSGAPVGDLDLVVEGLLHVADSGDFHNLPAGDAPWAFTMPLLVRHLASDIRTFYQDAISAQPGSGAPTHDALNQWIFTETALGEVLQSIGHHAASAEHAETQRIQRVIIPEGHATSAPARSD